MKIVFPSILNQLENCPNEFFFYFVLRPELVAKKIGKTKNKKNDGLRLFSVSVRLSNQSDKEMHLTAIYIHNHFLRRCTRGYQKVRALMP